MHHLKKTDPIKKKEIGWCTSKEDNKKGGMFGLFKKKTEKTENTDTKEEKK